MTSASTSTLDSVLTTLTSGSKKWVILLSAEPSADTATALHAVRYTGAPARPIETSGWSTISGSVSRGRSNAANVTFSASTTPTPVALSHWALVSTSNDEVPSDGTTYNNINQVLFVAELVSPINVTTGAQVRLPAGSLIVQVGTA